MGQVIPLQLAATPLEHARARMWHFMRRVESLRANGFLRAAAAAQQQEQIWEARAIELSRASRRRERPGPLGPSGRRQDTGHSSRVIAPVHGRTVG